jgi:hypothetical protein
MKLKIYLSFLTLILGNILNAQNPEISLEDRDGTDQEGAYYKDVHNSLDPFVGTWIYQNGSTSLTIVLEKRTLSLYGNYYYEDLIIGEYQYIENGEVKINTLNNLVQGVSLDRNHTIAGNFVVTDPSYWNCSDCTLGERRLRVGFEDPIIDIGGSMLIKKTTVGGQEAIRIELSYMFKSVFRHDEPVIHPTPTLPLRIYTLVKE